MARTDLNTVDREVEAAVEYARANGLEANVAIGGEQILPNSGGVMYFRDHHVRVAGDMNDMEVLKTVSMMCSKFDLEVDSYNGEPICDGKQARLVPR